MNEEIIKICIYFLEREGVKFLKNTGNGTLCLYKEEEYTWYRNTPFKIYHNKPYKNVDFFSEISKLKTFKKAYQNKCAGDLQEVLELDDKELYQIEVNTQDLDRHKDDVENFLLNYSILKVQSPMATRKTNIIYEIIEQSSDKNILMITNRRSLAQEAYAKYKKYDFHYYEHKNYNGGNIIVQFDSLYKYDVRDFDIVIIDEITSLLMYITEPYKGKEDKYQRNIDTFFSIDEYNKIVLLDSFILYNPFGGKTLKIYNAFRENVEAIEYLDKYRFLSSIIRKAQKEPISISSNQKNILKKIHNKLQKKGIRCLLLTGDNPNKDKILEELQEVQSLEEYGYDVLLYSPVVTTGISFFFNIKNHYHYDTSGTIDAVNSIQMIRRMRNVKCIHFFIQGKVSYLSTDRNKITYSNKVLNLFKMFNRRRVYLGLTISGEKLLELIRIKNILSNTHKYAFRELMKYQFKEVKINTLSADAFKI